MKNLKHAILVDVDGNQYELNIIDYVISSGTLDEIDISINGFLKIRNEEKVKPAENGVRYNKFPVDGGLPIAASVSGYDTIPWFDDKVTLIHVPEGYASRTWSHITYAKTKSEKRALAFVPGGRILVCWPGRYSQDIFIVDDMDKFRESLGFKIAPNQETQIDDKGRKWIL